MHSPANKRPKRLQPRGPRTNVAGNVPPRREGTAYLENAALAPVNDRLPGSPVPRAAREAGVASGGILNRNVPARRKPLRPLSKPSRLEISGISGGDARDETSVATRGGLGQSGSTRTVKDHEIALFNEGAKDLRLNVLSDESELNSRKISSVRNHVPVDADEPIAVDAFKQQQASAGSSSLLLSRVDAAIGPLRTTLEKERYPNAGVRLSDPIRAFGLLNHIDDPDFDGAASTLGFPPERLISAHAILTAHPDDRHEIFALLRETLLNEDGAVTDSALFDHYRVALNQVLEDGRVASRVDATLNLLNRFAMTGARKALTDAAPNGVMARGGRARSKTGASVRVAAAVVSRLRSRAATIFKRRVETELSKEFGQDVSISASNLSRGKAEAILNFKRLGAATPEDLLSTRQMTMLKRLPREGSRVVISRKDLNLADVASLTAATGVEFAMFTRGPQRLIVRGTPRTVPITVVDAKRLASEGWRWSVHTHPGVGRMVLDSSPGDRLVLTEFQHPLSVIYNSAGEFERFSKQGKIWDFR